MYKKLIKGDYVGIDITGEGSGGSFTRPSSLTIKNLLQNIRHNAVYQFNLFLVRIFKQFIYLWN